MAPPDSPQAVQIAELRADVRYLRESMDSLRADLRTMDKRHQQDARAFEARQLAIERGQSPMPCAMHDARLKSLERQTTRLVLAVVISSLGGGGVVAAAMRLIPMIGG